MLSSDAVSTFQAQALQATQRSQHPKITILKILQKAGPQLNPCHQEQKHAVTTLLHAVVIALELFEDWTAACRHAHAGSEAFICRAQIPQQLYKWTLSGKGVCDVLGTWSVQIRAAKPATIRTAVPLN